MIDSHAHLQDQRFADDLVKVVENAFDSGLSHIACVGYDLASSRQAIAMAEADARILAIVGIHPHEAGTFTDEDLAELYALASNNRVVAVGEMGLDYYYDGEFKIEQDLLLRAQIRIAHEIGKPVVIHDRDAHQEILSILREEKAGINGGIMHCYSGSWEMVNDFIRLGFYLSLAGPLTFKNAKKTVEVAANLDLSHLLVETDCPYLTPEPYRGRRNEPLRVWEVANKVAAIKGISLAEVEIATDNNCRQLFNL
ncbi:MAG: TatD family hydrolase [Methylocystaceae bacterium]